jgi:hypothetical protein
MSGLSLLIPSTERDITLRDGLAGLLVAYTVGW